MAEPKISYHWSLADPYGYVTEPHRIDLQTPQIISDDNPYTESLAHAKKGELELYVLKDDGKSEIILDTKTGKMEARKIGEKKTREGSKNFDAEVDRIGKSIGLSRERIFQLFKDSWGIYQDLHPDFANPLVD